MQIIICVLICVTVIIVALIAMHCYTYRFCKNDLEQLLREVRCNCDNQDSLFDCYNSLYNHFKILDDRIERLEDWRENNDIL